MCYSFFGRVLARPLRSRWRVAPLQAPTLPNPCRSAERWTDWATLRVPPSIPLPNRAERWTKAGGQGSLGRPTEDPIRVDMYFVRNCAFVSCILALVGLVESVY